MGKSATLTNLDAVSLSKEHIAHTAVGKDPDRRNGLEDCVPSNVRGGRVMVCDLDGTGKTQVSPPAASSWCPVWSPDGNCLAFYSAGARGMRVWLWRVGRRRSQRVSSSNVCAHIGEHRPLWHPDGSMLLFRSQVDGGKRRSRPRTRRQRRVDVWQSDVPSPPAHDSWFERWRADIVALDVATGQETIIAEDVYPLDMGICPNGRYLAVASLVVPTDNRGLVLAYRFELYDLARPGHRLAELPIYQRTGNGFAWASDGRSVLVLTRTDTEDQLLRLSLEGEAETIVSHSSLGTDGVRYPLWSPDGTKIYLFDRGRLLGVDVAAGAVEKVPLPEDSHLFGLVHNRTTRTTCDPAGDHGFLAIIRRLSTKQESIYRCTSTSCDPVVPESCRSLVRLVEFGDVYGPLLAGPVESVDTPPHITLVDLVSGDESTLESASRRRKRPTFDIHHVTYQTPDGRDAQVAVVRPRYASADSPAIMQLYYGTAQSDYITCFRLSCVPWLVPHGFSVILPDLPRQPEAEPSQAVSQLALAALEAVEKERILTSPSVGLYGLSRGGFDVCCTIGHTDRFGAAVAVNGFSDLVSFSLAMKGNEYIVQNGANVLPSSSTIWADTERYISNSPVIRAPDANTPLLLLHGADDPAVPLWQSEAMYASLRLCGKKTCLVRYNGEGHSLDAWSAQNKRDLHKRIRDWFNMYLRNTPVKPGIGAVRSRH